MSSPRNETENDSAWSSDTHFAVAIATRNRAFFVMLRKEASAKGSNGGPLKYSRTLSRSHGGGSNSERGLEISKERTRSLSIGDVDISGRENL